ncbi:hypothetical protein X975_21167, partial [Stegodyphus mimosarum]
MANPTRPICLREVISLWWTLYWELTRMQVTHEQNHENAHVASRFALESALANRTQVGTSSVQRF